MPNNGMQRTALRGPPLMPKALGRMKWSGKSNSFFVFDKWALLFIMLLF